MSVRAAEIAAAAIRRRGAHYRDKLRKTRQKLHSKKCVKLSGHTCVCSNLTSFECEEAHKNRKWK